jgi:hypothetical protein
LPAFRSLNCWNESRGDSTGVCSDGRLVMVRRDNAATNEKE